MPELIEIHEPGDFIFTMDGGHMRAWRVDPDGTMVEVHPVTKEPIDPDYEGDVDE